MPLLRKLRRLLRRRKGLLALGMIFMALATLAWTLSVADEADERQSKDEETVQVMADEPFVLVLETNYLCGTQTEIKQFEDEQTLQAWVDTQDVPWQLVEKKDRTYVMVHEVKDDLAPVCKEEGYFGLSEDGVLTIYQGPPTENQVIQTFFRIDTERLESKLPASEIHTLQEGIRIRDVADYRQVLSMYEEFAIGY